MNIGLKNTLRKSVIAAIALACSTVHARPFDEKAVSADAKWVMHFDVDSMTKTKTWELVEPKLKNIAKYAQGIAELQRVLKVKLPGDLHDVTLYGPSFGESEAVVVVRATMDQQRALTLLSLNEKYEIETIDGQEIHSWHDADKDRTMFGGLAGADRFVIGQSPDRVAAALNVIASKAAAINNPAIVQGSTSAGMLMYVAGDELAKLAQKKMANNPLVGKLDDAWIAVSENDTGLLLTSKINAQTPEVAQNLVKAADGLKAMLAFAGADDPDAVLVSQLVQTMTAKATAKTVDVTWPMPNTSIADLLDRVDANADADATK